MKKLFILSCIAILTACATPAKETSKEAYPYGMSEKEWNELSIKDKAKLRRDFYFYEKGQTNFVNPALEVDGRQEENAFNKN